ncbi:MAG: aminotransferase class V-fold PLP-dependent enzyme [Chloroflexi bacterium]|nr:aminotransferase class V-fold PLP-dependent enzyme [Chloroflexota bacterium]
MVRAVTPNLDSIDVEEVRRSFANIDDMVYLNTGTEGLAPRPVLDKLIELTTYCETKGQASIDVSRALIETARERVAQFLGVESSTIGFAENATEAVNWVASSLDFNPGDEVLLSLNEHPAMNFPWTYQRNLGRVSLNWFEISSDPDETLANIRDGITTRTRLIALSHVERHQGRRVPAKRICELAADAGVLVLLDGAQALGQFPVDLGDLNVDFYAGNGHKWLCGPRGTGIFYAKSERLPLLTQRHVGVGSTETPFDWDRAGGPTLRQAARRFEYGTRDRATLGAMDATIDWIEGLGFDAIQSRMAALAAIARNRANERGWHVSSPACWEAGSALVSFQVPGADGFALRKYLAEERNTWISHNFAGEVRVSTHYFNTVEEIDYAFEEMDFYLKQRRAA